MLGTLLAAAIGGPFPLLCTPYTEKGEVDCAVLAKFMYLRNLDNVLPSAQMRGWNLYVLKKRGVFPNTLSRVAKKTGGLGAGGPEADAGRGRGNRRAAQVRRH